MSASGYAGVRGGGLIDEGWRVVKRRTVRPAAGAVVAGAVTAGALFVVPGAAVAAAPSDGSDGSDGQGGAPAYQLDEEATAVTGKQSAADAPEIKPGTYKDAVKSGEEKRYSVALDGSSSYFLSATAAPEPGTKVEPLNDGIELSLETTGGEECSESSVSFGGDEKVSYPLSDYVTRIPGFDTLSDDCKRKGPFVLTVERTGEGGSGNGSWPVEIKVLKEPALKGSTPAAPADGSWSTEEPAPPTGGEKQRAKGGTGFNDAGAVGSGLWKDTIKPGETRYYRVPVDWGQRLYARAELPNSPKGDELSAPYISSALNMNVYNTARGKVTDDDFVTYEGEQADATRFTAPALYENRFADDDGVAAMRVAGWQYLAVTLHPDVTQYFPKGAPLTLRVDIKGSAEPGPSYDGDASAAGFGVTEEDREQAANGQTEAEAARSDTLRTVGYAGIGVGTVLLLGLGGWTLAARRGTAGPVSAGPVSAGPAATGPAPYGGFGPPGGYGQ